jgi:hypothetical protein
MDTLQDRLSAKSAVNAAFVYFKDLFSDARTFHVLLEGLEYLDVADQWRVVIGFDTGRKKEAGNSFVSAGLGERTTEPIREMRAIFVDAREGSFVRMESV